MTRVIVFIEGVSQNTFPNSILSCEIKIKTISHKCFTHKKFFSVKVNIECNTTSTDPRPVHYLGHWFQQTEALLHLGKNMIRKLGSLVYH